MKHVQILVYFREQSGLKSFFFVMTYNAQFADNYQQIGRLVLVMHKLFRILILQLFGLWFEYEL